MDDSNQLDPFSSKPKDNKPNPRLAGMGFFDDLELEEIVTNAPAAIAKAGAGIFGDLADLFKGEVMGHVEKTNGKMSIGGKTELNFQQQEQQIKQKEEASFKKDFYQKLESDRKDLEHQDLKQVMEDLVRLEVGAMAADEKNKTLHLSADFDEKNIRDPYHLHALRMKKLQQIKAALQEQKSEEMAATQAPSLRMRLDANEGQSMVSQSGAILSAG